MNSLLKKDQQHVWHPFDVFRNTENILVERAEGINLYTPEGRVIKDMVSSWWTNLHGHSHPHIAKAIQQQLEKLSHVIFSGFTHEPAIVLCERLLKILPGNMQKVFLSDNGSTAVEVGLKMAMQYWYNKGVKKPKILAFEGCYHGDTFGAMSLAGPEPFNQPFAPYLFEVEYLPFPSDASWEEHRARFLQVVASGEVAALIYEPMIQGVGGMRLFASEVLQSVLASAKEHQVLLIADEVMTGFGRTGKLFASEYLSTHPDIICMSKGITGGFLPLGATAANTEMVHTFDSDDKRKIFLHGHSYTGNPLCCTAANASLDLLLQPECLAKIAQISQWQGEFVQKLHSHPSLEWSNALGTILTLSQKPENTTGYFYSRAEDAYQYFLRHNLLLRPLGNAIYLSPPYCVYENELKEAQEAIFCYLEE